MARMIDVERLRRRFGDELAIMVDVNGHFDPIEAVAFGRQLADLGVTWFEEPARPMRDYLREWQRRWPRVRIPLVHHQLPIRGPKCSKCGRGWPRRGRRRGTMTSDPSHCRQRLVTRWSDRFSIEVPTIDLET